MIIKGMEKGTEKKTVEIFKTDVCEELKAGLLISLLLERYPKYKINFDLEDEDRILRVESETEFIPLVEIADFLNNNDVRCEVLS